MHSSYPTLCILLLLLLNIVMFVAFAPQHWILFERKWNNVKGYVLEGSVPALHNTSKLSNRTSPTQASEVATLSPLYDCPEKSNLLVGRIEVDLKWSERNYWMLSKLEPPPEESNETSIGDYKAYLPYEQDRNVVFFEPDFCRPTYTVAVIIPFRARESHLKILLGHLIPILRRQLIRYTVFVVEQQNQQTFNKGRLMNTGFLYASAFGEGHNAPYDCYLFQDVDLLAQNDNVLHRCYSGVHHLSTSIDKFNYKRLCCGMTVGGVLAIGANQFRQVNGFSNTYWGWGAEDDDMNKRIKNAGLKIVRPEEMIGRYTMIKHDRDEKNPIGVTRLQTLKKAKERFEFDGLNDLDTAIEAVHIYPLFVKVLVHVGNPARK